MNSRNVRRAAVLMWTVFLTGEARAKDATPDLPFHRGDVVVTVPCAEVDTAKVRRWAQPFVHPKEPPSFAALEAAMPSAEDSCLAAGNVLRVERIWMSHGAAVAKVEQIEFEPRVKQLQRGYRVPTEVSAQRLAKCQMPYAEFQRLPVAERAQLLQASPSRARLEFEVVSPMEAPKMTYLDDQIAAELRIASVNAIGISMRIKNLTSEDLELNLDEATFVRPNGDASRLLSANSKSVELRESQNPLAIPAGATADVPVETGQWLEEPMHDGSFYPLFDPLTRPGETAKLQLSFHLPGGVVRQKTIGIRVVAARAFFSRLIEEAPDPGR